MYPCSREPAVGIEPTTARLRIECSTTELRWLAALTRIAPAWVLFEVARAVRSLPFLQSMPWRGLEPRRLAAPPPQDGVSTNFTTRALTTVISYQSIVIREFGTKRTSDSNYPLLLHHGGAGARTRDLSSDRRVL